jgi:hypothetical protein
MDRHRHAARPRAAARAAGRAESVAAFLRRVSPIEYERHLHWDIGEIRRVATIAPERRSHP